MTALVAAVVAALAAAHGQLAGWLATGAIGPLVGCSVGLLGVRLLAIQVIRWLLPRSWTGVPAPLSTLAATRWGRQPVRALFALFPRLRPGAPLGAVPTERSRRASAELLGFVVALTLAEELLFFALPTLGAPTPASTVAVLSVTGMLWALGHGVRKGVGLAVTGAWLKALFWISGLGWLSIALHLGQNLVALGLRVGSEQLAPQVDGTGSPPGR